jgi:hypothetical protein
MKTIKVYFQVAGLAALSVLSGCAKVDSANITDATNVRSNSAEYMDVDRDDLPPIKASITYRCDDNTLALVEYLTDDVTAIYRGRVTDEGETLVAPEPGKPFVSDNYAMSGSISKIELKKPGKDQVTCTS